MTKSTKFPPEVIEGVVRMVFDHRAQHDAQWAAIVSIAAEIGCMTETLRRCVRQHERETAWRERLSTAEQDRNKLLEREVRELLQVNEILRKASAHIDQAGLDRRFKP